MHAVPQNLFFMYAKKIRAIREMRGYSQDYVAAKLGIAQNSYSRIETCQTKMNLEMLEKLAKILNVTPADIMSAEPIIVNFNGSGNDIPGPFHRIEQYVMSQKELYEKIIASKDAEIAQLKKTIDLLTAKD